MPEFAQIQSDRENWSGNAAVPRHCHADGYAAIVLSGHYEECGSRGRFRVGPGDILFHDAFDAHLDRFGMCGTEILNLALPARYALPFGYGHVDDPDAIARAAETDRHAAIALLQRNARERVAQAQDWPDLLAAEILHNRVSLGQWAEAHHLSAETLSRGFGRVFGLTPAAFRREARARQAFVKIVRGLRPLAIVAAESGFADQAHMSRAIKAMTGRPPAEWRRRSISFKTDALRAA